VPLDGAQTTASCRLWLRMDKMTHTVAQVWDPFLPATIDDPYPLYEELRKSHPVYHNSHRDLWAISRFDDILAVNADWQNFSSADGIDVDGTGLAFAPGRHGNVVETDPPLHGPLRRVLRDYLTPKWFRGLEGSVRVKVQSFAPSLLEDEYDIAERLCSPLPLSVICDLLGVDEEDGFIVGDCVGKMFYRAPGVGGVPESAVAAVGEIHSLLERYLRRRLTSPADDALTVIAHGRVDDRALTLEEQLGMSVLILAAGIRTARNLLTNIFWYLGTRPDLRRQLVADPTLSSAAVEEFLRFDAPGQLACRVTTAPVEIQGVQIPEHATVAMLYGSANRDEQRYEQPNTLDVGRKVERHFSFGAGIHSCIGAPLARLEAKVVLEEIVPLMGDFHIGPHPVRSYKPDERGFEKLPIQRESSSQRDTRLRAEVSDDRAGRNVTAEG
jgi:cytochrome P450